VAEMELETADKPAGVAVLTVLFAVNGITLLVFGLKFFVESFGLTIGVEGLMLIIGTLSLFEAKWIWEFLLFHPKTRDALEN